ncbi:MBL fold metallo-hydrolase [Roseovarius dicentrarchi]|uniref:MBL fold metallo-hydrolase n=1 Tax=Roseovarius dicentrarchi TaxID=2250573 RepID=UPI000DEA5AB3|nr:MBL fold metallo-hydrolase [Roseovarius dicentrarchi]
MQTRRTFLTSAGAAITVLPFAAYAARLEHQTFDSPGGDVSIYPIDHASFLIDSTAGLIAVDPVGHVDRIEQVGMPTTILITHEHGDHFDLDTIQALIALSPDAHLVVNPAVMDMLPDDLAARSTSMANGDATTRGAYEIEAIPAYNITEERLKFHPKGRDNGYVITHGDFRIYVSGDTEDTPEMRALQDIDLAFVCMNLPFTMESDAAASAVAEFAPTYVYPYHYRGRDGGTQDPAEFAAALPDGIAAKFGAWYPGA